MVGPCRLHGLAVVEGKELVNGTTTIGDGCTVGADDSGAGSDRQRCDNMETAREPAATPSASHAIRRVERKRRSSI